MNFDTNWDVDQYKTEHECDEHWDLRRSFMEAHKEQFCEERLVCLAQVFTNVEFLGCRYPAETMQLVAELSQGVAESYREKQKTKLQRTFVKASDAAGAKVKGLKRPAEEKQSSNSDTKTCKTSLPPSQINADSTVSHNNQSMSSQLKSKTQVIYGPPTNLSKKANGQEPTRSFASSRYGGVRTYHIDSASKVNQAPVVVKDGPYGRLVLIDDGESSHPTYTVQRSMSACQVASNYVFENLGPCKICCKLYVNGKLLAEAIDLSNKSARDRVSHIAVEKLRETCYTLRIKAKFFAESTIDKSLEEIDNSKESGSDVPLSSDNIGSKLMRLMGWSGGGLGKDQQGIQEPVSFSEHVKRSGLGLSTNNSSDHRQFKEKVNRLLRNFAEKESEHDLVFSSDFTNDERNMMHQLARKFNLKTKSYGRKDNRHLVISKKNNCLKIVEEMLQSGRSSEKYEVISPTSPSAQ